MLMTIGYHEKDVKTNAYVMLSDVLEVEIARKDHSFSHRSYAKYIIKL